MMKTFPCIAVFMSSMTIMAIAVDRYRIILHSQSKQVLFEITASVYNFTEFIPRDLLCNIFVILFPDVFCKINICKVIKIILNKFDQQEII